MRAALGVAAATAQQHDARYEQHRRKAAGGKKECPSPLLPVDGRAAQLTTAERFRVLSRVMRKLDCRLRLNEVSRQ